MLSSFLEAMSIPTELTAGNQGLFGAAKEVELALAALLCELSR